MASSIWDLSDPLPSVSDLVSIWHASPRQALAQRITSAWRGPPLLSAEAEFSTLDGLDELAPSLIGAAQHRATTILGVADPDLSLR
jgi:hypothetical protein